MNETLPLGIANKSAHQNSDSLQTVVVACKVSLPDPVLADYLKWFLLQHVNVSNTATHSAFAL